MVGLQCIVELSDCDVELTLGQIKTANRMVRRRIRTLEYCIKQEAFCGRPDFHSGLTARSSRA